ncbi:hypothetical protein [Rhizobium deserti]|nr:hypothetical protein [Rhizobium deserti]
MADPQDKDPAEGSRETIDNELKRAEKKEDQQGSDAKSDQKGPAQPA